jgi:molybdopterin-guanine dinucleotide biosynthesis protein A
LNRTENSQYREGAILAGGKSSRMGQDKALLEWRGKPLIQSVAEVLLSVCDKVRIIADRGSRFSFLNLEVYPDEISGKGGKGPLGGIYTALQVSDSEKIFCVGCDMPFLDKKTIQGMLDMSGEFDVVVPYSNGDFHPLHAVYSQSCREPIKKILLSGPYHITGFFDQVRVKIVDEKDFSVLTADGKALANINTPADLENLCRQ